MTPFFIAYKYAVSAVIIITFAIIGWATFPFSQKAPYKQVLTIQQSIDTSSWQTYRNEELGFEMKLPPEWDDQIVTSNINGGFREIKFSRSIIEKNALSGEKVISYYNFLTLQVFPKSEWTNELEKKYNRPQPSLVGVAVQSEKHIFAYSVSQDPIISPLEVLQSIVKTLRFFE